MAEKSYKVLFLTGRLDPRSITSHTLYLAAALAAAGHDVRMASPGGPLIDLFQSRGVPCITDHLLDAPLLNLAAVRRLRHHLEASEWAPDLIHIHAPELDRIGAALAGHLDLPLFLSIHGALHRRQRLHLPVGRVSGIIAGSQEIRENLVNHRKVNRDWVKVISTGVDLQLFRPDVRIRDPKRPRIPVVGMVGRLEVHKGAELFMRAARIVSDQDRGAHFLICGNGPDFERLRHLSRELSLEGVLTFASEVRDYRFTLDAIDIFVRPSTREGLGISLLEAMACGKPIVASGVGSVFQFVRDGETGILVPREDVTQLALAMTRLVTNPAKALEMGRRARKLAEEHFDIAKKAVETVAFYSERLNG